MSCNSDVAVNSLSQQHISSASTSFSGIGTCNGFAKPETSQIVESLKNMNESSLSVKDPTNATLLGTAGISPEEADIDDDGSDPEEPVIDVVINNVVCSFSVGCHLDLRHIATQGNNVEFRRENSMVSMKLRRPHTTASIWSSGKITCTGSTSEPQASVAARRVTRCLQKLGYKVRLINYRIVNVLGTCTMPFAIRITLFSQKHRGAASYEPELHPGVTYKIDDPKATLKIFSTGSITVTAPSVSNVQRAIEMIYPLVEEFSKEHTPEEKEEARRFQQRKCRYPKTADAIDSEFETDEDSSSECL